MGISRKDMCLYPIVALLLLSAWGVRDAGAAVSVNINIGPPPIMVAEPPEVVMVPGARIFFVPDPQIDIFFYAGYWYSPRGTRWYRASVYNGPWVHVIPAAVPHAVVYMPRDYRVRYADAPRHPYGHWKRDRYKWEKRYEKDHRRWEKEREREWRDKARSDRYNRHYLRGNGPGPGGDGPGRGPGPRSGGPRYRSDGPGGDGPGRGPGPRPGGPRYRSDGPGGDGPGPGPRSGGPRYRSDGPGGDGPGPRR